MNRTWLSLVLTLMSALALAACGSSAVQDPTPPADPLGADAVQVPSEAKTEEPAVTEPVVGGTLFQISGQESEVRFVIDEILDGTPNTVIGKTNDIQGQIIADLEDATSAQVDPILIDLSTLATDNSFRNRALGRFILQTGNPEFQFAEFVPTEISGLPERATIGQAYPLQISGDLSVKGTSSLVTFEGSVTPVSATRLEGTAFTTVRYEDLGVTIPRLPEQVASVDENVRLEIDIVALAG